MTELVRLARDFGFADESLVSYGPDRIKVFFDLTAAPAGDGRLFVIAGMTPPREGVGKSSVALALTDALNRRGTRALASMRHLSLGEAVGKGPGKGYLPRIEPEEVFRFAVNQDSGLVASCQNLFAALADQALKTGAFALDPQRVFVKRCHDLCDDTLRRAGFVLAGSSELMAILALVTDPDEVESRVGQMIVGCNTAGGAVRVRDFGAGQAAARILKCAARPDLMRTSGGSPCLVHTASFAHTSLGSSSITADRMALAHGAVCVTETGYGSELGLEKFFDIKVRAWGRFPERVILVVSVSAIRAQGDGEELDSGMANLGAHVENVRKFGYEPVVVVNRFESDSAKDLEALASGIRALGFLSFTVSLGEKGHPGMDELAEALFVRKDACSFTLGYKLAAPLQEKVESVARTFFGAEGVEFSNEALEEMENLRNEGYDRFPVMFVKTPFSLGHASSLKGRPKGYMLPVKDISYWAGAGVVRADCGGVPLMPSFKTGPEVINLT